MQKRLLLILLALFGLTGCGVVSPLRNGTTGNGTTSGGKLYVSTGGSILRFANALSASGNVGPEVTITGTSSQLNSPERLFVDTTTDRLFVANAGASSVLIFSPASTATAGSSPSAVLTSTGNMVRPFDLAIDPNANLLYVADGANVLVFANQSGLSGAVDTAPVRTINFPFNLGGIFLDASANILFIADPNDNNVDIIESASTASGSGALLVNGVIGGTVTALSNPVGVALDGGGRVIVSNGSPTPSILIFPSAVVPSGDSTVGPSATISGSSTLIGLPGHIVFNSSQNNGELYVADNQAPGILIFTNINGASGSITSAPARSIIGSGTLLNADAVNGVALDVTR